MKTEKEIVEELLRFKCKECCDSGCSDGNLHEEQIIKKAIKQGRKQRAEEIIPRLDTLYDLILDLESKVSYHVNISDHKQEFKKAIENIKLKLKEELK